MSSGDYGSNYGNGVPPKSIETFTGSRSLRLVSKPIAKYTELAREKCIEGKVRLRIEFLANGALGKIYVVKGLPYGLTEQAIEAAKRIKFEPAVRNWEPVKATRELEYNFTIY